MIREELRVGGGITYWHRLSNANRATVSAKLKELGYSDAIPNPPTFLACLKSALEDEFSGTKTHRISIRPIENGYSVVEEPSKKLGAQVDVGSKWANVVAKATCDERGSLCMEPYDYGKFSRVQQGMNERMEYISSNDVGKILVSVVSLLDGVSHRDNGVVYWIPMRRLDEWKCVAEAIENASAGPKKTDVVTLTVTIDQELMNAVASSLTDEVMAELAKINDDITEGSLKEDACLNRLAKSKALMEKIVRYEHDMEIQMNDLHKAVKESQKAVAWATMQVSSSDLVHSICLPYA